MCVYEAIDNMTVKLFFFSFFDQMNHTHAHTHVYIYVYIVREREGVTTDKENTATEIHTRRKV